METAQELTDDNNNNNSNIKTPTREDMKTRFNTLTPEEKMKYYGDLKGCKFIENSTKRTIRPLTAEEKEAINDVLNGRGIRKKKKRLVSARKHKNKVTTSKKTDDNITPSRHEMQRRFRAMTFDEKMEYYDGLQWCTCKEKVGTHKHGFTDAEKSAIARILDGGIRKKKKRLASATKLKNMVSTS